MAPTLQTSDGVVYRDLNGNGQLDPYEDVRLPIDQRVDDLLGRLSLAEKVGLMFHTVIEVGEDGALLEAPGQISKSATSNVVLSKLLSHFNVHALTDARLAAQWHNGLQRLAEQTPHGIPVTISSDPRHAFHENAGASFATGPFSQWPEPLGLAALRDPQLVERFGDIVRQEYCAVGIRAALHPTLDLATEPRWARQRETFGNDAELVTELGSAYLRGMQKETLGSDSVACCAKHFPGGGPQLDGEDAHFPYGREQVYPAGKFDEHLAPFRPAVKTPVAAVMPYYGMPIGLSRHGEDIDPVGFGFNGQIVTDLLRDELGYDGVVLSDWELITDNVVGDQVLPARAWGVEHLDAEGRLMLLLEAGVDQFGGEECVDVLLGLVADGKVLESRLDVSVRRLLTVKFALGLFDDPFVDENAAAEIVGSEEFRAIGHGAQAESVVILQAGDAWPARASKRVYAENMGDAAIQRLGERVERPEDADVAIVRLGAPFEPRSDLFLEAWFHQGSLDFPPGLIHRLARIAASCPLNVDVTLDRPAVLTPLLPIVDTLLVDFGTSDDALVDVLTGKATPRGRLPIDLPSSMEQVRRHAPDQPGFDEPLFAFGFSAIETS